MSGDEKLSGPDLAQGIPLADVPDGGQLLGHSGGEAVLVVRRGEEVFAIGASCVAPRLLQPAHRRGHAPGSLSRGSDSGRSPRHSGTPHSQGDNPVIL